MAEAAVGPVDEHVLAVPQEDVARVHLLVDEGLRQLVRLDRPDEVADEIRVDGKLSRQLGDASQAPVRDSQCEQVVPARDELKLQLRVAGEQRLERLDGGLALESAAHRLAGIAHQHPTAVGVDAEKPRGAVRPPSGQRCSQSGLVDEGRRRRLEVRGAVDSRNEQHRRPGSLVELLDRPGALGGCVDPRGHVFEPTRL
jgi:hypothetical protein